MKELKCKQLSKFMKAQCEIVKKHIDEHKYLRKMDDKNLALESFINDYGWLIREIFCSQVCENKDECQIADDMKESGDLLSKRIKP